MLSGAFPLVMNPKAITCALVSCLALFVASSLMGGSSGLRGAAPAVAPVRAALAAADVIKPQTGVFQNVEVAWRIPPLPKLVDQRTIRRVLLLFHGCTHRGLDWFTFPEESILVQAALRLGYVVVAFTSQDRWNGCWDSSFPPSANTEVLSVKAAYGEVLGVIANEVGAWGRAT